MAQPAHLAASEEKDGVLLLMVERRIFLAPRQRLERLECALFYANAPDYI